MGIVYPHFLYGICYFLLFSLLQLSLRVQARLNTKCPGVESLSTQKYLLTDKGLVLYNGINKL